MLRSGPLFAICLEIGVGVDQSGRERRVSLSTSSDQGRCVTTHDTTRRYWVQVISWVAIVASFAFHAKKEWESGGLFKVRAFILPTVMSNERLGFFSAFFPYLFPPLACYALICYLTLISNTQYIRVAIVPISAVLVYRVLTQVFFVSIFPYPEYIQNIQFLAGVIFVLIWCSYTAAHSNK